MVIEVEPDALGRIDLGAALQTLGGRGLTRLLVEGGARLAASLLRARLVDRLVWMGAPLLLGAEGVPAVAELGLAALAEAPRFEPVASDMAGPDQLAVFRALS